MRSKIYLIFLIFKENFIFKILFLIDKFIIVYMRYNLMFWYMHIYQTYIHTHILKWLHQANSISTTSHIYFVVRIFKLYSFSDFWYFTFVPIHGVHGNFVECIKCVIIKSGYLESLSLKYLSLLCVEYISNSFFYLF